MKLILDSKIYPLEAIYQTCNIFLDRAYIFLDSKSSGKIEVFLKSKEKISEKQLSSLRGEFLNELLNSALRLEIAKRNKNIREAIIGQALLSASNDEKSNFQDDPLGIAVPWEEKYGKQKTKKEESN
ncbi:MAG: His-Xaa-Ser system protein HxsD [Patescibacteria group bacterium]|nr:His-Xaa-Ser system protein HxsD [Patescibacteria group bacterium]